MQSISNIPMSAVVNQPTSSKLYPGQTVQADFQSNNPQIPVVYTPGTTIQTASPQIPVVYPPGTTLQSTSPQIPVVYPPGTTVQSTSPQIPVVYPPGTTVQSTSPQMPVIYPPGASIQYQSQGVQLPVAAPANVWMPLSEEDLNAGFNYLAPLDGFFIQQYMELIEVATGFETNNRYVVKNTQDQIIFMVYEDSRLIDRMMCGPLRAFDIKVIDYRGVEVIHLSRNMNCQCCCCPCCLQEMQVLSPVGKINGVVKQKWSICKPSFCVKTDREKTDFKISGPACMCCSDIDFQISDTSGQLIGNITKKWMGFFMEAYTKADNFTISFPQEISVNQKIMLMASAILLDFMYFENNRKRQ